MTVDSVQPVIPNTRGKKAYTRGFEAFGAGKSRDANPGAYMPAGNPFVVWWDTGYIDAEAGEPNRFEQCKPDRR